MSQSRFCEQCGAALAPGIRFCESCGQPVAVEAQVGPLVVPTTALPLTPPADASSEASPGGEPIAPRPVPGRPDRRLMAGLIGIAALLLIAVVTVVLMRSARDRSPVTVNEPSAGPALALTPTAVGLVPPTAPPETPGAVADSTPTSSSQPTLVAAQGAVAAVSTSISREFTMSSSEGAAAATPGLSPAPPATPSPAVAIDLGASPPPSPQMAGDSGASAALVGRTTYLPLVRASKAAAKSAGAAAKDPVALLAAAQAQVAGLKAARLAFQRTLSDKTSSGSGWLRMPDRISYTIGEGADQTEWVILGNRSWFRDSSNSQWTTGITVPLINNPHAWLQLLQCAAKPRALQPETVGGEARSVVAFNLTSKPTDCAAVTGVQSVSGGGALSLRQRDQKIARLRYDLVYTGQMLRGGVNAPLQITLDFSDWNSDTLPEIVAPVSAPTPSPTRAAGAQTRPAAPKAAAGPVYGAVTFSSEFDQEKVAPINPAKTFPYGVKIVYACWTYSNVVPETEFFYDWYRNGTRVDGAAEYFTASSGKAFQWLLIGPTPKTPLDPGNYRFVVRVGDQEILSDTFVIQR